MQQSYQICAVFVLAIFGSTRADTPANCTYDDIAGTWTFREGPRGKRSHEDCDSVPIEELSHSTTMELLFPNVVVDSFGNEGTWTIVYNQGFEVNINSRRYFAFSNWTAAADGRVVSLCDETKRGWSHDVYVRDWSCYVGAKHTVVVKHHARPIREDAATVRLLKEKRYRTDARMVDKINRKQSSWVAHANTEFEQLSLFDVFQHTGGFASRVHERPRMPAVDRTSDLAGRLPVEFDWRNVDGVNYVSPVRNQGACGSCYAFASLAMLEARYRIYTNNTEEPVFSPEDVVQCSEYSQGCKGGFAYLVAGKYAEDFGVVNETCNPYHAASNDAQCQTSPSCRRFYATNYRYTGGYFGASNEPLMRLALVNNGPLAVGMEVYPDFMNYHGGIYHHTGVADNLNRWADLLAPPTHNKWDPFHLTNHAVLVVGYGRDARTFEPFWIVKNSWGARWGEEGFFRIHRGTDECAIESEVLESDPIPTY